MGKHTDVKQTQIYNRIELSAFTVLAMSHDDPSEYGYIACHIAGFATAIALAEVVSVLDRAGAYGAIVALEEAAGFGLRNSCDCNTYFACDSMKVAFSAARNELEAEENRRPDPDPDELGCRPWR